MFQNMPTELTPLANKTEITSWENRPYSVASPECFALNCRGSDGKPLKMPTSRKNFKRVRIAYTTEQLNTLEKTFVECPYITRNMRLQLASLLNVGEKNIKVWFQNRRMKKKKDLSESSDSSSEGFAVSSPQSNCHKNAPVQYKTYNTACFSQNGTPNTDCLNIPQYKISLNINSPPTWSSSNEYVPNIYPSSVQQVFCNDTNEYPVTSNPSTDLCTNAWTQYDANNTLWSANSFDTNYLNDSNI